MKILVVNAGSSSLKFQLFESSGERLLSKGLYDGLGTESDRCARHLWSSNTVRKEMLCITTHEEAVDNLLQCLTGAGVLVSVDKIAATAHRVVHGGEMFSAATVIDDAMLGKLNSLSDLAPLHNPINISCITILRERLPSAAHYAVFDTAFHQTMPEEAYLYGLPYGLYRDFGIRKYGFHGTNHKYVACRTAEILQRPIGELKIITCHLGNGQSICAVKHGRSIDTSMGFTPLEGLPMGTRSGSFDPEIILFLLRKGYTPEGLERLINRESGLAGVSGLGSDYRTIEEMTAKGHEGALRAQRLMVHRITCTIGACAAEMEGVDAIAFTGGIGENSPVLRKEVLAHFAFMGVRIDAGKNDRGDTVITGEKSTVSALVIPANEELQIVRDVMDAMMKKQG